MKLGYTNICSLIGTRVIQRIFINSIVNNTNYIEPYLNFDYNFNSFLKKIDFKNKDIIILGDFLLDILQKYPVAIFERSFDLNDDKDDVVNLKFNESNFKLIKDHLIVEPASLPMVCEPIKWSDTTCGGYINNIYIQSDIIMFIFSFMIMK